jgi:hypothetical protein
MTVAPSHPLSADGASSLARRDRRASNLRAYATREDGSIVDVTLNDLGHDGCGIICALPLREGERMILAVHRRGLISATVRWSHAGRAGLMFIEDRAAPLKPESKPRAHERVSVSAQVILRRLGKLNFPVSIYDLSPVGCKAEVVERPEVGEQVWIKFEAMEALEASVAWVAGSRAGVKFTRPIHQAVFDLLLQRLK